MTSAVTLSRLLLTSCCIVTLGCASTSSNRPVPPRLMTRTAMPLLSMPSAGASRVPMTLLIEVEVDEEGRADVETLTLTGQGTTENRAAIEHWLGTVTFRPAQQNGVPVRGVYKMRVEGKTTVVMRRR